MDEQTHLFGAFYWSKLYVGFLRLEYFYIRVQESNSSLLYRGGRLISYIRRVGRVEKKKEDKE